MELRDHSRPCKHGGRPLELGDHFVWLCDRIRCPGGAPVVIDYEAAEAVLRADHELAPYRGRLAVNAALGIVEVDDDVA